ncbi:MAG TPA: hypothetical protein VKB60_01830 [Terriglobales bacterium]|nr:hypothetical protein [Terriglobales bacterium]
MPLLVTSLDPSNDFSEVCETLVVNAHGCAIRSPMEVKAGIPVHFHTKDGRQMMARIIDCQRIGSKPEAWRLGAQLDAPDNFWGLNPCPEDWVNPHEQTLAMKPQLTPDNKLHSPSGGLGHGPEAASQQIPADRLQKMVAPLLQPLQAEVAALQQKLIQRETNRSRFEVSLSHIPPELEQELWGRLRQDIGQRALQMAREESDRVLGTAHAAIERKLCETQTQLQQHASDELKQAQQRAQALADGINEDLQQQFRSAVEQFQMSVAAAETRLSQQGEELVGSLHQQLESEHQKQQREIQRLQGVISEDWSRVRTQIAAVENRLAKLDESARHLESDFEARLAAMASEVASITRAELEGAADVLVEQLTTRNAQVLATQLDDACARLQQVQREMETSISEVLQDRIAQTMHLFERKMDESAQQCIERWSQALANQLNSAVSALGQPLRIELRSAKPAAGE